MPLETMHRTVADIDMVGYSDVARMLEARSSAASVTQLNQQIQAFITDALKQLKLPGEIQILARTGDGGIVLFERPEDAHIFARHLQQSAIHYNEQQTEPSSKRRFRIGIATGKVSHSSGGKAGDQYAGIAIADSVRLQTAASPDHVLIDSPTFKKLTRPSQQLYAPPEEVHGKRDETFRAHRLTLQTEDAAKQEGKSAKPWWELW